ncbi:MAG TPA: hypothetical protein VJG32_06825 [Anaerolineae bacterium]|nr:hypothetical protein [Anaerolineae bacterium]
MEHRSTFQAATLAAIVALVCIVLMGFVLRAPEPGVSLQPSYPPAPAPEFVRIVNTYPDLMLRLFTTDSLFVLSYLMVFVGLYATVVDQQRALAVIGLGAGILTAFLDATENAYFITYAHLALNGMPLANPDLPAIFIVANLKWMAAFATLAAFGLGWPRRDRLGWVLSGLMLLFVLIGVLGIVWPNLFALRGLFFLIGMPLFAWHFWRQASYPLP